MGDGGADAAGGASGAGSARAERRTVEEVDVLKWGHVSQPWLHVACHALPRVCSLRTQGQSGWGTFYFLSRPQQLEAGDCDVVCFWLPLHEDRRLFFPACLCCSWDPPWFLLTLRPLFSSAIISSIFQLATSPRRSCNSLAATARRRVDHLDHLSALPLSSRPACLLAIACSPRLQACSPSYIQPSGR